MLVAGKFTGVRIEDDNVILLGEILAETEAGSEIVKLWKAGVNTDWSIRGWGDLEPEQQVDDNGNESPTGNLIVRNYVWDGCDIVLRGAAKTKTLKITQESQAQANEVVVEENEMLAENQVSADEMVPEVQPQDNQAVESEEHITMENKKETPQETPKTDHKVDLEAIRAESQRLAREVVEQEMKAAKLAAHKEKVMAEIADSESVRELIRPHIEAADSIEKVDEIAASLKPKIEELVKPKKWDGIGIINKEKTYREYWVIGESVEERPETPAEVKAKLLEGIKDTGVRSLDNPRHIFACILDNYERNLPEYLMACTKQYVLEAATTTTALGTTVPQVLPLLRKTFPKLVPYIIASVQPLNAPDGRVYTLDYQRASDDSSFADSSSFDSTWADHTEGDTKAQVVPSFSYTSLSTSEKAIYFNVTSALIQDMQALHNVDAEAELLQAAADEIAREINYEFLETLRAGATAYSGTYGTSAPSGYTSDLEWYRMLAGYIGKASARIASKSYVPARFLVCDPEAAGLLTLTGEFVTFDVPQEYGAGLTGTGTFRSTYQVFVADWFTANTILVVGKGDTWSKTGAVYAPYIPLYLSPQDYNASTNTLQRSVSSRYAMAVLNGNTLATITIEDATGTPPY